MEFVSLALEGVVSRGRQSGGSTCSGEALSPTFLEGSGRWAGQAVGEEKVNIQACSLAASLQQWRGTRNMD